MGHKEVPLLEGGRMETNGAGEPSHLATFDQHRGLLFSVAYRMLGSVADAEDMVQEAFLRWLRTSGEDIRSPRALLITIVSRLCINHLQSARIQREEYIGQWLPEPLVTDPRSDPHGKLRIDESLSMAFLLLLERLTPIERAVFLLREVFSYKYSEIEETVGQTETNCHQILRRARKHVGVLRPRFKAAGSEHDEILERFLKASRSGDMDGLIALLSKDIVLHSDGGGKTIAVPNLIYGAERVGRGILRSIKKLVPENLVSRSAQINGEPGFVGYLDGKPFSVITLHVTKGRIREIYVVSNPEKLKHLANLPAAPS